MITDRCITCGKFAKTQSCKSSDVILHPYEDLVQSRHIVRWDFSQSCDWVLKYFIFAMVINSIH